MGCVKLSGVETALRLEIEMSDFHVFNMQTEETVGWVVRAMKSGLKVTSRPSRFGDEINLVKDGRGNFLTVTQNTQASRRIDGNALSVAQLRIVVLLIECGLVAPPHGEAGRLVTACG